MRNTKRRKPVPQNGQEQLVGNRSSQSPSCALCISLPCCQKHSFLPTTSHKTPASREEPFLPPETSNISKTLWRNPSVLCWCKPAVWNHYQCWRCTKITPLVFPMPYHDMETTNWNELMAQNGSWHKIYMMWHYTYATCNPNTRTMVIVCR